MTATIIAQQFVKMLKILYVPFFLVVAFVLVTLYDNEFIEPKSQPICFIATATLGCCLACLFFRFLSITCHAISKPKRKLDNEDGKWPNVSIIRPLHGTDPLMAERIESIFKLNYPGNFEIIFCLDNGNDQAKPVVERIMQQYAHIDAKICIDPNVEILNPCLRNLEQGIRHANYKDSLIWLSAARVSCDSNEMKDMVVRCCQNQSLVVQHQYVKASCDTKLSFINTLERVFFSSNSLIYVLALQLLNQPCVTSMSLVMTRNLLKKLGGCRTLGKFLAEDFIIGETCEKLNINIDISHYPVRQDNSRSLTMESLIDRQIRWLKLRLNLLPTVVIFLEKISLPLITCLLFSMSCNYLFGISYTSTFFPALLLIFIQDFVLFSMIDYTANQLENFPNALTYIYSWFMVQFLQILVLFIAAKDSSHIIWGNKIYTISNKTLIKDVNSYKE